MSFSYKSIIFHVTRVKVCIYVVDQRIQQKSLAAWNVLFFIVPFFYCPVFVVTILDMILAGSVPMRSSLKNVHT